MYSSEDDETKNLKKISCRNYDGNIEEAVF